MPADRSGIGATTDSSENRLAERLQSAAPWRR